MNSSADLHFRDLLASSTMMAASALLLFLFSALQGCASTSITAASSESAESASFSEPHDPELETLSRNLAHMNVQAIPSPYWEAHELEAIAEAISALPAFLRPTDSEPLRLARIPRSCLLGMGRYNGSCPTFSKEGIFFLYDPVILGETLSEQRLLALPPEARFRLLRKRAVTHALVAQADLNHKWSRDPRWRRINGWDRSGTRPKNRNPRGYLSHLGQSSAHLDLLTSAESFFFRVEDLLLNDSSLSRENFDPDETFSCQEFTRARILSTLFEEKDPHWRRNTPRALDQPTLPCDDFHAWARLDQVQGLELLFASEHTEWMESLFGNLFLRIAYDPDPRSPGDDPGYLYQFDVVTAENIDPVTYLLQGITGGFLAVLDLSPFSTLEQANLQLGERSLRRFRLPLDAEETRYLMERIWEAKRQIAYPYYLTTQNSASMLLDLLAPVLSDQHLPRRLLAMPTDILDILAGREFSEFSQPSTNGAVNGISSLKEPSIDDRSLTPSNSRRLQLALRGAPASHFSIPPFESLDAPLSPRFDLHLAILDDHLGQRRLHGHRPEIEAVVLAMKLSAPFSRDIFSDLDAQLTLLRYITLSPRLGSFGWGGEVEVRFRNHELPVSGRAFFGLFLPLALSASGVDHIAIGLGPLINSDILPQSHLFGAGLQAYLLGRKHLGGAFDNALVFRLRHFEAYNFVDPAFQRQGDLRTGLEFFLPAGAHGLLLSPFLQAELLQFPGSLQIDDRRLWAGISFEPLLDARRRN